MSKYLSQCSACEEIQGLPVVPAQWPVKLRGTGASTGLWEWPVFLQNLGGAETIWTMTSGRSKSHSRQFAMKRGREGRDRWERKRREGENG